MKNYIFVTGMMRSGTNLAQIILTNHPSLFVTSQPFFQLFLDVKQMFNDEHGLRRLLPLGDGIVGDESERNLFNNWLENRKFNEKETSLLLKRATTAKGSGCSELKELFASQGFFVQIWKELHDSKAKYFNKEDSLFIGSKDAFCEEYIPSFIEKGIHCLIIIRDPRAVIASACHGRYFDDVGYRYPLLMLIRLWRKSAAYALAFKKNPYVHVVRYEDLTNKNEISLQEISEWLNIPSFPSNFMQKQLVDHSGNNWNGNSSFANKKKIEATRDDVWRSLLSSDEIAFIEACTKPELETFGYKYDKKINSESIKNFTESIKNLRADYLRDYRMTRENIDFELNRYYFSERQIFNDKESSKYFLFHNVFAK